jgi:hypothetical protein
MKIVELLGEKIPELIDLTLLDLLEMANLTSAETGLDGCIYVSTHTASHGPRVTWYPKPPKHNREPCVVSIIGNEPESLNFQLPPQVFNRYSKQVETWVSLNMEKLLKYWYDGNLWTDEQREAFKSSLIPLGDRTRIPPKDSVRAIRVLREVAKRVNKIIWHNGAYNLIFPEFLPEVSKIKERFRDFGYHDDIQVFVQSEDTDEHLKTGTVVWEKDKSNS